MYGLVVYRYDLLSDGFQDIHNEDSRKMLIYARKTVIDQEQTDSDRENIWSEVKAWVEWLAYDEIQCTALLRGAAFFIREGEASYEDVVEVLQKEFKGMEEHSYNHILFLKTIDGNLDLSRQWAIP